MGRKRKSKRLGSEKKALKKVNFRFLSSEAQNVSLVDDFNNLNVNSHLLEKDSNETWKISIDLISPEKCTKCGRCLEVCIDKAIVMEEECPIIIKKHLNFVVPVLLDIQKEQ